MQDTNKVAAIGDADFVMPFSALGVDTYPTDQSSEQAIETARKIVNDKYALVIVAENIAPAVEEVFSACQDMPTPCIVVVPFTAESKGVATKALGEVLKFATGINILRG